MPVEWLVRTVEDGLAKAGVDSAEVVASDLWELPAEMSTPIVDEMLAGHGFPMVLAGERVVCFDGIDLDAIVRGLSPRPGGNGP